MNNLPIVAEDFLNYLKNIEEKSPNTVKEYGKDLKMFFDFYKNQKQLATTITIEDVRNIGLTDLYSFLNYLSEEHTIKNNIQKSSGAKTKARKISTLKSFFKYLKIKAKLIDFNPTDELENPKLPKKVLKPLTIDECKKILTKVKGVYKERDFLILTLFMNLGVRLNELTGINLEDIHEDEILIHGKGNKERLIYLNENSITALNNYLKIRPKININALFVSNQNKRISNITVYNIVKKYSKGKIHPHDLRHSCATAKFESGATLKDIQEDLGHANLNTTEIYTHVSKDRKKKLSNLINI